MSLTLPLSSSSRQTTTYALLGNCFNWRRRWYNTHVHDTQLPSRLGTVRCPAGIASWCQASIHRATGGCHARHAMLNIRISIYTTSYCWLQYTYCWIFWSQLKHVSAVVFAILGGMAAGKSSVVAKLARRCRSPLLPYHTQSRSLLDIICLHHHCRDATTMFTGMQHSVYSNKCNRYHSRSQYL